MALAATAQDDGQVFRVIDMRDEANRTDHINAWLDLAPDGRTLAVAPVQSFPFRLWDTQEERITRTLDVGNWYAGSRAEFTSTGRYLLLQQLFYLDFSVNKDRPVKHELVEVASGKVVLSFDELHAAAVTPDETAMIVMMRDGAYRVDIASGRRDKLPLERTGYALALSNDGKRLAVSHKPTKAELEAMPSVRNDKDAIKRGLKDGRIVVVYDLGTLKPMYTLGELFDKVFRLEYSPDGKDLWIHAKPNSYRTSSKNINQSYLSVADAVSGEMRRTSFPSLSPYEPDFRASPDGKLLAIASQGNKFMEVHLYDRATGRMVDRFVVSFRLFEKSASTNTVTSTDARMSFCFLPDSRRMLIVAGNRLIEWTYKP
ncbi:MAG: WD40 repeat domain-containing protein [Flavobacteriales bacterium]|nr:WD40 repeat domain-containing protein [Flavobacteriales bacterium]